MATKHPQTTREQISLWNTAAASRFGMKVRAYQFVKAATRLAGVASGIYAMSLGADPMTTFVLISVIVAGPDVLEYYFANGHTEEGTDDGQ